MRTDPELRGLGCVGDGVRPHIALIEGDFRGNRAEAGDSPLIAEVLTSTDAFAETEGRRPRILVAKMGRVIKTGAVDGPAT